MSSKPLVSVIVVNYNGSHFVGDCIDSVLASSYPNFEVIVIDNASTDGSFTFLKKNYGKNEKVRILKSKRQLYFTGGGNLGAKKAGGEKLFFLNSDTIIHKNCLGELAKFAKGNPKYLVQPKILLFDQKDTIDNVGGKYSFWGFGFGIGRDEKDNGQYDKNCHVDFVNGTAFMINRDFFLNLGGFDESFRYFYEDVDLSLRAKRNGGDCWYCPKGIIYHKGSLTFKQNVTLKKRNLYLRRNRILTIIKNEKNLFFLFLKLTILSLVPLFLSPDKFISVLHQEIPKFLINRLRLEELKSIVEKEKFSLLDLGCGDASFLKSVESWEIDILGVDKVGSSHPKVVQTDIEDLILNRQFEVITLYHVLEHLKNPEKTFARVKKLLKKDGLLVVEVPLAGNLTEKFLGKDYFAYSNKTHRHLFTKKQFLTLLQRSGFLPINKGATWYEFPFTVITTGFRRGLVWTVLGILFFSPLKILSFLGFNDEIVRYYLRLKKR